MGIASLFLGWLPIMGWLICVLAIYFGFKAIRKNRKEGRPAGKQAKAGIILGVFSLFFGMLVLYSLLSSGHGSYVKLNSLTKASAMPTETLGMYIKIPEAIADGEVKAMFSDGKGYTIDVPLFYYNQEAAVVSVPVYFSQEGNPGSGRVNLSVIVSSSGVEYSSNSIELEIKDLPVVNEKPGTITLEYLARAIEACDSALGKLAHVNVEGVSTSELQQALTKQKGDLTAFKNHTESSMKNPANPYVLGKFNGQQLKLDEKTLGLSDRLIAGFLIQYQQGNEESPAITGNAILADSVSFSDSDLTLDSLKGSFDSLFLDIGNGLKKNKETMVNVGEVMVSVGGAVTLAPVPGAQVVGPLVALAGATVWFAGLHVNTAAIMAMDLSIDSASDKSFGSAKSDVAEYLRIFGGYIKDVASKGVSYGAGETGHPLGFVIDSISTLKSVSSLVNIFNEKTDKAFGRDKILLMVGKEGDGYGSIISQPPGINCPGKCTQYYTKGSEVKLSAVAGTDSSFAGWSGACSGKGECAITLNKNAEVAGTFSKKAAPPPPSGNGVCSHSSPRNACGRCSSKADCGGGTCWTSSSRPPFC